MTGGIQLATTPSISFIGVLQIEQYTDEFVNGFLTTMGLYLFAIFFGLGLGIFLAIVRHYGGPLSTRLATAYIEIFRGTPLLAQVLVVTLFPRALNAWLEAQGLQPIDILWRIVIPDPYGTPSIFLDTRILLCAITLGLNSAAYQAEYFRGAMASISSKATL